MMKKFNEYFKISIRKTTIKKEIIGGISTFFAMAYILAVNPGILSQANGGSSYTGALFLATALSAFFLTFLLGMVANVPIAAAPGMGMNAFVAYTVAGSVLKLELDQALVCCFVTGILYFLIVITPARKKVQESLPKNIRLAIGAMIGFFIAYIGLNDSGIIASNPATKTQLGSLKDPLIIIGLINLLLVFTLYFFNIKGSVLIAMISTVVMLVIAKFSGVHSLDASFKFQNFGDFSQWGKLSGNMWKSFPSTLSNGKAYIAIFVLLYINFFDTTGTLMTLGTQAKLDDGHDKNWMAKANQVDAVGTIASSMLLTSSVTAYVESGVGIAAGAKTGIASLVTSLCFILSIAIWPILGPILPVHTSTGTEAPVTGPILIFVGSLMVMQLIAFDWNTIIDIPVLFITIVFGMLSYSISAGIAAGIIVYGCINTVCLINQVIKKKKKLKVNSDVKFNEVGIKETHETELDFKHRLSIPIIIMIILGLAYFVTLPLYA